MRAVGGSPPYTSVGNTLSCVPSRVVSRRMRGLARSALGRVRVSSITATLFCRRGSKSVTSGAISC